MILDKEVFVSGLVDESGDLFICFEETVGKGIKLYPVIFNDNDGKWCLNLWYAKPSLGHNHLFVSDRAKLKDYCRDYFLMLRHNGDSSLWTVICRSWRVRTELGLLGSTDSTKENSDYRRVLTIGDNCILLKYRINNYNTIEFFDPELRVGVIIFR